jgi:hypothetical protein
MTQSELEIDLSDKYDRGLGGCRYFSKKLFDTDPGVHLRRSFGDLFEYYNEHDVTEEMLMKAFINLNVFGIYCNDIRKLVFFIVEEPSKLQFIAGENNKCFYANDVDIYSSNNGKYTYDYLCQLYDSVKQI